MFNKPSAVTVDNKTNTGSYQVLSNDDLLKEAREFDEPCVQEMCDRLEELLKMVSQPQIYYRDDFEKKSGVKH